MVAVDQLVLLNDVKALAEPVLTPAFVKVLPPAVYPVPTTSFVVVYTVVVASIVDALVYNAILNVFPVDAEKS